MSEPESIRTTGNAEVDPHVGRGSFMRRWRWPLIVGGPLLILAVVAYFVITGGRFVSEDDAYVQVIKVPVAPSIGGRVVAIYVKENQRVQAGELLFRIDPRDPETEARAAAAQLADAELQVKARRAAYEQQLANVQAAQETAAYAIREAARQRELGAAGVASQQQVDQAVHAADQARKQLDAARQQAAQALAVLGGDPRLPLTANPTVMQAAAQLQRAKLNVSYTTVTAPSDGIVTRVEQMPVGSYVRAAQTAFWLLSGQPWVEANFKENELGKMRVGQPAEVTIDAYPDAPLAGHVASFSPGTGAAFSALPAQNATGNWVKVVQRLPVRIDFDRPPPPRAARAGLSAHVKVDVRHPGRAR